MAKKVKIPVKEDSRQNSAQYGYQGNVRNQYGYNPADVDFYDDKDIVEKKDSRQAQVVDDSHEEKLYRLLFRISKKLKEEEEKAAVSSTKEPEIKAHQSSAASDPDPKSAARPDSKTSAEPDERDAVIPVSALSPGKSEVKDINEPVNQNTVSPANESGDSETVPQASAETAGVANAEVENSVVEEKASAINTGASEESESEEKTDVAEQPEHAQAATPSSDNTSDSSGKVQELPAPASAEGKASAVSIEEKSEPVEELPEAEKKTASGGGGGSRMIDMADASMDDGPERVEEENTALDKKEKSHLDAHSKAKAAQAGSKIGGLSTNQKKKEDATTKLDKTKDAVVEKTSEKEAEVNAGQVGKVAEAETPEVNKDEAKSTLNQSLQASLPQKVEDVDNFKDNRVASKIGDKVKAAIDEKAGEVTGTFEVLDKTPKPEEPRKSVPFADIEQAPATPEINAGNNLIPKVDEKSIDLNSYLTESDNLLKKEGIKQEHLDLVDSGDLFEARKIQKDIDKKAKEEPGNLRAEEKDLHGRNEAELQKKEADEKGKMQKEREAGLGSARGSQVGTKGSLEDKKKEVTDHINKIYEDVNKQVQDKLAKLKTDSLATFDREEAAASSAFENNVNTKMDKFKDERYSGLGGKFNKVRDWFLGIDDLPEVKQIFEEEKAIYVSRIDSAISKIINDSQKVIDECKTLIANARKEIEEYVKGLSPALQKIGEEAEKEIRKKLDELDEKVNKAAEELKEELARKRAEAIANIDKKIEKMKEEMSGFLSKMGDLLVDAALKFFKWALEAAGHSADEIMGIINKGKAVLTAVVSDPIQFLKNLAAAVGGGVKNFGSNILKHLGEGFMNWLTGQLNSLPIQLPEKFDLKGIVSLTLQVLGLTYASLRSKLSNKVGEDKVQMAETGVEMMMEVKEKGPIAMYDMMADKADSIKNEFIEGAKEWAITNMIKQGLVRLATMINPAGAIVQAVLGIYNGVIFLVNNWDRILAFVNSVFDSIAAIASGAISQASAFVEKTMAQTIPLILDFIAQQLNLSGIAERITKIIHRIRKPIDQVIDKIIDFITNKVKKIAGKLLGKDKAKDKHKEKAEDTKKDFDKDKGDDKTTDVDRKEHQKYVKEIIKKLKEKSPEQSFEKAYQFKIEKAKALEVEYTSRLKKGLQTTIKFEPFESAKKDHLVSIHIHIGPNNEDQDVVINPGGEEDGKLDQNVPFTGADDKQHSVHLIHDDKKNVLNLEPEGVPVKTYLNSLDKGVDVGKLSTAKLLVDKIKTISSEDVTEGERKEIVKNMDALAQTLMDLVGIKVQDVPDSADWKFGTDNSSPKYARVERLSYKTLSGGSSPADDPKGWALLQKHGLTATDWVRMHLILEKIGGPGVNKNMVPGPKSVNSGSPMKTFEGSLRQLFKKDEGASTGDHKVPSVVWIYVAVTNFHEEVSGPSGYDSTTFAKTVSMTAGHYYPDQNKKWVKDPTPNLLESSISIPAPDLSDGPKIPNLNGIGEPMLVKLGFSNHVARQILKARGNTGFASLGDLEFKLDELSSKAVDDAFPMLKSLIGEGKLTIK